MKRGKKKKKQSNNEKWAEKIQKKFAGTGDPYLDTAQDDLRAREGFERGMGLW